MDSRKGCEKGLNACKKSDHGIEIFGNTGTPPGSLDLPEVESSETEVHWHGHTCQNFKFVFLTTFGVGNQNSSSVAIPADW